MAVASDLIELSLRGTYDGQATVNVFHVIAADAVVGDIESVAVRDLTEAWLNLIMPSLQLAVPTYQTYQALKAKNLSNPSEQYENSFSLAGTGISTGQPVPAFIAVGVRYVMETAATRPGAKRFCGLTESAIEDYGQIVAAEHAKWVTAANATAGVIHWDAGENPVVDAAELLSPGVVPGDGFSFIPVVIGRVRQSDVDGGGVYTGVPVGTLDLSRFNRIVGASVDGVVTSQVSRKRGRGI